MVPSSKDIDAMRKLRSILDGAAATSYTPAQTQTSTVTPTSKTGRPDVDAMADILRRFNTASEGTAEKLVENSKYDSELREFLHTQKTQTGVKIGRYEVASNVAELAGKKQKVFDVVASGSEKRVFSSLTLIEAAHAIVRYLNKGLHTTDKKIQYVVELEETYTRNRMDALRFKHRYERCVQLHESQAGNVFADRYQVARANALVAMDQITSILNTIR
jgi:hypothetical protein